MDKTWSNIIYGIFLSSLIGGGILRIMLKLFFTDTATGFYSGGVIMRVVFHIMLGAGLIALPVCNLIRETRNDFRTDGSNKPLLLLATLVGLSILYYTWYGLPDPLGQVNPGADETMVFYIRAVNYALGGLAGIAFIASGLWGLALRKSPPPLLSLFPVIWQVALLLSRFNRYYSILAITDHLLAILFAVSASMFFLGHARTISGFTQGNGRNYVISSGLCTAICGFFLSVPNYLYMLINASPMPSDLMSVPESIYAAVTGVYALVFTLSYVKTLRVV